MVGFQAQCNTDDEMTRIRNKLFYVGCRFGNLTIDSISDSVGSKGTTLYDCSCDCGSFKKSVYIANLKNGATTSCGCNAKTSSSLNGSKNKTHGMTKTRTYKIWDGMIQRCTNINNKSFKDYGQRGINVSDSWRNFEIFLKDMGEAPIKYSIDRIDNNGNYEVGNCRWVSSMQNAQNKRNNVYVFLSNGENVTISEAARLTSIPETTLRRRFKKNVDTSGDSKILLSCLATGAMQYG
jgi:hypothetical protein